MPTIPWLGRAGADDAHNDEQKLEDEQLVLLQRLKAQFYAIPPPLLALTTFALGALTATSTAFLYTRYGRRLRNSEWVTPDYFTRTRWIKGVVTAVGDADNFRLYHTPALGWHWPFKFRRIPSANKDLKNQTLHIRIAGVDAPEGAHFGRPSQPYHAESLSWLRDTILGKVVYCQLLRRDQYSRIVAHVTLAPRIFPGAFATGKVLSLEMLRAGWVTTYEQAGAEHGKWGKDEFLRVEAEAKAAHRGMWKHGVGAESPAEYKRRHATAASLEEAEAARPRTQVPSERGRKVWLRRLLRL
ncbi:putative to staphylococcal nuclease [Lyophyllum shimeji]|uniref:To staphylococcal nuclease n=1 Tax=Lyophyllum shimeji TaxID=47721 RepID=A0A9P3UR11_LYOSH|nr:putative to staphylococcal nuclease [Lyophyllum shimeji]